MASEVTRIEDIPVAVVTKDRPFTGRMTATKDRTSGQITLEIDVDGVFATRLEDFVEEVAVKLRSSTQDDDS